MTWIFHTRSTPVGDVFRIGGALVEVSQPRIPCYKLALKMGIEGFQNRFLESGRVGFYFRVLGACAAERSARQS